MTERAMISRVFFAENNSRSLSDAVMNIEIDGNQDVSIQSPVENGRFESNPEAIAEAIRLLEAQEKLSKELSQDAAPRDTGEVPEVEEVFPDILAELIKAEHPPSEDT